MGRLLVLLQVVFGLYTAINENAVCKCFHKKIVDVLVDNKLIIDQYFLVNPAVETTKQFDVELVRNTVEFINEILEGINAIGFMCLPCATLLLHARNTLLIDNYNCVNILLDKGPESQGDCRTITCVNYTANSLYDTHFTNDSNYSYRIHLNEYNKIILTVRYKGVLLDQFQYNRNLHDIGNKPDPRVKFMHPSRLLFRYDINKLKMMLDIIKMNKEITMDTRKVIHEFEIASLDSDSTEDNEGIRSRINSNSSSLYGTNYTFGRRKSNSALGTIPRAKLGTNESVKLSPNETVNKSQGTLNIFPELPDRNVVFSSNISKPILTPPNFTANETVNTETSSMVTVIDKSDIDKTRQLQNINSSNSSSTNVLTAPALPLDYNIASTSKQEETPKINTDVCAETNELVILKSTENLNKEIISGIYPEIVEIKGVQISGV